tara:strand:- start:157 stop:312 length:156 start_codon:yes stop_codon:yes gene_type:complete
MITPDFMRRTTKQLADGTFKTSILKTEAVHYVPNLIETYLCRLADQRTPLH